MSRSHFALETDDGLAEDPNAATEGTTGAEHGLPPLETPFQKEASPSPQIRVNLNYRPGLVPPDDPNYFDNKRIFQAVVAGGPEQLIGLTDYLRRTSSFLTDTQFRDGKTGKTCLMKALLHLKDGHNPTIPLLLKIDKETENPKSLVNAACTDSYYEGQTALHIAIEKRNLALVTLLVENGACVRAMASGLLFQKDHKKARFYFGELPLSLAACTDQSEVVKYLLHNSHQKARLTEQDSIGNTVLHALVMLANNTEKNTGLVVNMYDTILVEGAKIDPSCKLEEIKNKEQLTPLTLAVKTGKIEILKYIFQREMKDPKFQHLSRKFTEWTYGPIRMSLYDLTSIDSEDENSVLEILAYNSDIPNRNKMVILEPLNRLLRYKWESFVRKRFFLSFFLYGTFMTIFTVTAYHHPPKHESLLPTTVTFPKLLRLLGVVVILIGGIYLFINQSVHFCRRRFSLKGLLKDSWFSLFLFGQAFDILASCVMFFAGMESYIVPMVFALLLGFVNMVYYIRGFKHMGIYIVMIQKVILEDLLHFLLIYMVLLVGFTTGLIFLTGSAHVSAHNASVPLSDDSKDQAIYLGPLQTALLLFRFTIGMGDLEYKENLKHSYVAMLLVLLFVILTYILLLNMLIALMSERVAKISVQSKSIWQLQRALTILEVEKYWIGCWKKPQRAGCYLPIGSEDKRWFFRVKEVNWEDWTEKLVLKEEPQRTEFLEKSSVSKLLSWVYQAMCCLSRLGELEEEEEEKEEEKEEEEEEEEERVPMKNFGP